MFSSVASLNVCSYFEVRSFISGISLALSGQRDAAENEAMVAVGSSDFTSRWLAIFQDTPTVCLLVWCVGLKLPAPLLAFTLVRLFTPLNFGMQSDVLMRKQNKCHRL